MIDTEKMENSQEYREGVIDGFSYGTLKTIVKVIAMIEEAREK